MPTSASRLATAILVAATGAYLGVSLAVYAEADDAPGGVLIGAALALGAIALGVSIARGRWPRRSAQRQD